MTLFHKIKDQSESTFLKLTTQLEDTLNYKKENVDFFSDPWKQIPSKIIK